jgi:outer membrane protein OmpA-like peptidoglycan-associated protein
MGRLSAGGYRIRGPIEHHSSCGPDTQDPDPPHGWTHEYVGHITEASVGFGDTVGAGVSFSMQDTPNDLFTSPEWSRDDFALEWAVGRVPPRPGCIFVMGSTGSEVEIAAGVRATRSTVLKEWYAFTSLNSGAVGDGRPVTVGLGLGIGSTGFAEATSGMLRWRVADGPEPNEAEAEPLPVPVAVSHGKKSSFAVDSHRLTPAGRKTLARHVAHYRAFFEAPTGLLVIEGDASRTGGPAYNETLSWKRSLEVFAFVRSLLTAPAVPGFREALGMGIVDGRIRLVGHGESKSEDSGAKDEVEADDWRRTLLILDGRALVIV